MSDANNSERIVPDYVVNAVRAYVDAALAARLYPAYERDELYRLIRAALAADWRDGYARGRADGMAELGKRSNEGSKR